MGKSQWDNKNIRAVQKKPEKEKAMKNRRNRHLTKWWTEIQTYQ